MMITISGKAGSGKSTVAKTLSKKLKLKHYSIGDLMREMAQEKNISLIELNKLAEKDKKIDFELDNKLKNLGKTKKDFIVDGRLTAFFIPTADVRVFLDTDDEVRAKRIVLDKRHGEQGKDWKSMLTSIKKREDSERKRYQKYYKVNYLDKKLYNLLIDTTEITPEEVVKSIITFVNRNIKKN
ncbi:MAG: (d)CMP kinase [Nanoarchaeota archaeon]